MYNRFILNTIEGTPGIYCSGDTIEKVSEQINIAIDNGYIKEISSDGLLDGKNSVFK